MNSFFKNFWAALLAFIIGTVAVWMLGVLILSGMVMSSFSTPVVHVTPGSVLKIDMGSTIVDAPSNKVGQLDLALRSFMPSNTLMEVLKAIEIAGDDPNIEGIYINYTGTGTMGIAQAEEVRAALTKFREGGKFIVAYNLNYSHIGYYLASVADEVYVGPEGMFDWAGLSASVMFYKGLLDKLDIEVEILRHGTFKSAVEPFMADRMSPANRLQVETYVNSMWNVLLDDISASRGVSKELLGQYANTLAVSSPAKAHELGFVDGVLYEDQVMDKLTELTGGEGASLNREPALIPLHDYIAATAMVGKRISKNKVAIVYAEGSIEEGENSRDVVGAATVAGQLAQARKDKDVKAVVFRINSPGGSAPASEVMWREMELLRQEKPVIVSMGNYAASGGYYIACNADMIIADRSTLTGSIGVFGMMLNIDKTLRNKLGLTTDVVKTGPHADLGSPYRGLDRTERAFMMNYIENVYKTFVGHVAEGRNMTFEAVDAIGEGRVWLGADAANIGLVDAFGGIYEAVSMAAERAGVAEDFRVYEYVETADPLQLVMEAFGASAKAGAGLQAELGDLFAEYKHLRETLSEEGVQARMPYVVKIN